MIQKKRFVVILSLLLFCVCGCSNKGETTTESSTFLLTEATTENVASLVQDREFLVGDVIPLIYENEQIGTVQVNQVSKVMISDWFNQKAQKNKINFSYAVNLTVKLKKVKRPITLTCTPTLINNGVESSSPCQIGWSGFPKNAQLYDKTLESTIEVGFQPEKALTKDSKIKLYFTDDCEREFESITLGHLALSEAKKVGTLLTKGNYVIKSFNGARYSIGIDHTYDEALYPKSDADYLERYYSFRYIVKYLQKPTNKKRVVTYDEYDGELNPKFVIGVQSDVDPEILYEGNLEALRKVWENSDDVELYATNTFSRICVGKTSRIVTNRKVPNTTQIRPKYLRFYVDFGDELESYTVKEKLKSNTRYVVFQQEIQERKLQKKKN